uniref:Protein SMG7 n=1 Tax=Kwoniella dejecticola CBS 10117 TaxID=1296121 RepID=A0A1A6AF12_9TREE|nr:uncharacterized protein I303_00477 [Kwoniella dejecticola CBS 10117]OBR88660.1 hypothetical protein I303_00477 [Kwoniella dejecticola CBS 10117]
MSRQPSRQSSRRSAAELDRDARNEAGNLKNILNNFPPWSREAEQSRQRCRETHLLLLFSHPLSPYSQTLDNLWHQTTYLLIASYRNIISNIERSATLSHTPTGTTQHNRRNEGRSGAALPHSHAHPHDASELRKAVTRFKQYLSTEESFYKSLISRIYNFHNLAEVKDLFVYLNQVKIPLSSNGNNVDHSDELPNLSSNGGLEKKDKLNLIYKGLICLGDLERYKDQYREPVKPRRGNGGREAVVDKFGHAREYYEVARCIQPDDGAAFNQLAVISTYLSDPFSTTYYYFRASAIKNAFKGIDGILYEHLGKTTERWRARRKEGKEGEDADQVQTNAIKRWKDDMIVLIGILYLKAGFSFIPSLQPVLLDDLSTLARSRQMPTETIVQTIVIAMGLHHHARSTAGLEQNPKLVKRSHEAETKALELLLGISDVVMKIAIEEIEDVRQNVQLQSALAINDDEDEDLDRSVPDSSSFISAVLRRILPSLRIMSKWMKMDLDYLQRHQEQNPSSVILSEFWKTYRTLITTLGSVFPIASLPSLPEPLEEDIDMRGFVPLQRGKTAEGGLSVAGSMQEEAGGVIQGDVHPNEQQLMRLADIQVDAKLITQSGVGAALLGVQPLSSRIGSFDAAAREQESDIASVSTETEDDPVNLAMRATLASESSVDGDEQLDKDVDEAAINVRDGPTVPQPTSAMVSNLTKKPTAYDLLQNLMLESTPTPPSHSSALPETSTSAFPSPPAGGPIVNTPSPHLAAMTSSGQGQGQVQGQGAITMTPTTGGGLLFGAGPAAGSSAAGTNPLQLQNNSIWTMTREESEKGQKRSSGQANIAAIWGAPTITTPMPSDTANNHNHDNNHSPRPQQHTQYAGFAQVPNPTPHQAPVHIGPTANLNTAQQPYYTHQSQYPYQAQPSQTQAHAQSNANPWGMSNIPLPIPANSPGVPYSHTYDHSQNQNQTQSEQVPYYLQPAYYASKTTGYGNWGNTGAGA